MKNEQKIRQIVRKIIQEQSEESEWIRFHSDNITFLNFLDEDKKTPVSEANCSFQVFPEEIGHDDSKAKIQNGDLFLLMDKHVLSVSESEIGITVEDIKKNVLSVIEGSMDGNHKYTRYDNFYLVEGRPIYTELVYNGNQVII